MRATVAVPRTSRLTTPLGVGMATLMREPSAKRQQRLLAVAYEAGFRHFDVAPSYGLGTAEKVLGRFLRTQPDGVTVATKVGITARPAAALARAINRPARALVRRFPGLRGRATQAIGTAVHASTDFSHANRTRSLEQSLRALGTGRIDLLLLHEVQPSDLHDSSVVDWVCTQRDRGIVACIGIATSPAAAAAIVAAHPGVFDVAQTPSQVLAPAGEYLPRGTVPLRVSHSVLATPHALIARRMSSDAAWSRALSERAGRDLSAPGQLARLLLALGHHENPGGIVLLGASKPEHLSAAPDSVGAFDDQRLADVAAFLSQSFR